MGRFITFLILGLVAILSAIATLGNPAARMFTSASSRPGFVGGASGMAVIVVGGFMVIIILGFYEAAFNTRSHNQSPTRTRGNSRTTTKRGGSGRETEPIKDTSRYNGPSSSILDEDWSQDTTDHDTGTVTIDENPGRTRSDYQNIDPNIGADEPRISDRSQTPQRSGSTGYSEEQDDEDLSDLDVDLDDI